MSRLNPRQQEAVNYVGGPLVVAGAGSGKTSVITLQDRPPDPELRHPAHHIVAMTFTNKAAWMKERVGTLLQGAEGRGLTVSTFHNLGMNIIRKGAYAALGYKPGFSIFDDGDIRALLTDIMQKEYAGRRRRRRDQEL